MGFSICIAIAAVLFVSRAPGAESSVPAHAVIPGVMEVSSLSPTASLPIQGNSIPPDVLKAATARANGIAGTNVTTKAKPGGPGILVIPRKYLKGLAKTFVADEGTEDESDDWTVMIQIDEDELEDLFPGILEDQELYTLVMAWILSHEFDHVLPDDGGNGTKGGIDCQHLADKVADCEGLCDEVSEIRNDEDLSDEEKCKRVGALCVLHKYIADSVNTDPSAVEAAEDCEEEEVGVEGGKVIQSCAECPSGECPVHGTEFGQKDFGSI